MAVRLVVRHPQGDEPIALQPTPADKPVIIGRSAPAHVVIESTDVSRKHSLLYVDDGQWVIHDAGSRSGTFVNGERIVQPTPLNIGDVIRLGRQENAIEILVEPAGAAIPVAAPVAATEEPSLAEDEEQSESDEESDEESSDDSAAFDAHDVNADTTRYYVPHQKPMTSSAMTITIVLVGAAVLGGIFALYKMQQKVSQTQPTLIIVDPTPVKTVESKPKSVFDFDDQQPAIPAKPSSPVTTNVEKSVPPNPKPPSAPQPQVDMAADTAPPVPTEHAATIEEKPSPAAQPPADQPPDDPARYTTEWRRVEDAHRTATPTEALWVFRSYRTEHPDTTLKADLDAFDNEAFDRLWWYRVKELCDEATKIKRDLAKIDQDIAAETNAKVKKQFEADREVIGQQLQKQIWALQQMNYESTTAPDVYDETKLDSLRKTRDAEFYERWKKQRLNAIKLSRGRNAF